jgi:hypothetical protein
MPVYRGIPQFRFDDRPAVDAVRARIDDDG